MLKTIWNVLSGLASFADAVLLALLGLAVLAGFAAIVWHALLQPLLF